MDKRILILTLAILDLIATFILFTDQAHFSSLLMVSLFLLVSISAFLFYVCNFESFDSKQSLILIVSALLSFVIITSCIAFYGVPSALLNLILSTFFLKAVPAILLTIGAIYFVGRYLSKIKAEHKRAAAVVLIIVTSLIVACLVYLILYGLTKISLNIDEPAYDYYAGVLLLHGQNPYTSSMLPILTQYHIPPPLQIDGLQQLTYGYPALTIFTYLPTAFLGPKSFFLIPLMGILFAIIASMVLYYECGFNKQALLPISIYLLAVFIVVSSPTPVLAISIFLLAAYLFNKNVRLSAVFAGLAISITQIAWFAIPFYYLFSANKNGKAFATKQIIYALLVFLVINGYFLAISPQQTITRLFSFFGSTGAVMFGPNIMQFLDTFYAVPFWFLEFVSVLFILFTLALSYLYAKSLKPTFILAPMLVFFLSWRNLLTYALPYVPILLYFYLARNKTNIETRDAINNKKFLLYGTAVFAILSLAVLVYAHDSLVGSPKFSINYVDLNLSLYSNTPGTHIANYSYYSLNGLSLNVTSYSHGNQNVSIYVATLHTNTHYYYGSYISGQLTGLSTREYNISYNATLNKNSQIFVLVFSPGYMATKTIKVSNLSIGTNG